MDKKPVAKANAPTASGESPAAADDRSTAAAVRRLMAGGQTCFDLVDAIIVVLDVEAKVTDVNQRGCAMLGYDRGEIVGQDWFQKFVPPDVGHEVAAIFKGLMSKAPEGYLRHENPVLTKSGEERMVDWSNLVLRDEAGRPIGALSSGIDITERLRQEERMSRLTSYPEQNPIPVVEVNLAGDFIYLNPAARKAFPDLTSGFSHPAMVGIAETAKALAPGEPQTREVKVGPFWFSRNAVRLANSPDIRLYFRDITDSKKAGESLLASEKKFRDLVENMVDVLMTFDLDGRITYVSPQIRRYGYEPEELIGQEFRRYVVPEDLPPRIKHFQRIIREGTVPPLEGRLYDKQGGIVWFEDTNRVLAGDAGRAAGVLSVLRDITDKKKNEEATAAALSRYQQLYDQMIVGAYRTTSGAVGDFLEANQTLADMFDAGSHAEFLKVKCHDLYQDPAERQAISEEIMTKGTLRREIRFKTFKGRQFWGRMTAVKRTDTSGQVFFEGFIEDISDQKRNEEKIHELDQLRHKFIQIVSQQSRAPLETIRLNLESLFGEQVGKLTVPQKEFIRMTRDIEVEVMNRLRDMLIAMDIEAGRVVPKKAAVSLESLWGAVMGPLAQKALAKGVKFEYHPPKAALPSANVDAEEIREVMSVLVDNAVSYTPAGGQVSVDLRQTDGVIRFAAKDTGIGVPATEKGSIFKRFFRASNAAAVKADASGLGLTIAKHYVEQHGGRIGFESEEGQGSTFWFELPVA